MSPFVHTVLFGFAGSTQFELVAGDYGQWPIDELRRVTEVARSLATDAQSTRVVAGSVERHGETETCLVAVPVDEEEAASGRDGLSVVLGVVLARRLAIDPSLPLYAFDHLVHVITGLVPNGGLNSAAELLTKVLQTRIRE